MVIVPFINNIFRYDLAQGGVKTSCYVSWAAVNMETRCRDGLCIFGSIGFAFWHDRPCIAHPCIVPRYRARQYTVSRSQPTLPQHARIRALRHRIRPAMRSHTLRLVLGVHLFVFENVHCMDRWRVSLLIKLACSPHPNTHMYSVPL